MRLTLELADWVGAARPSRGGLIQSVGHLERTKMFSLCLPGVSWLLD